MADQAITETLCEARRAETAQRLETIERDVSETRTGVGKLLRVLLEGNGQPAITARITACENEVATIRACTEEQKAAEKERVRTRAQTRVALWLALGGWVVTLIGIAARFI